MAMGCDRIAKLTLCRPPKAAISKLQTEEHGPAFGRIVVSVPTSTRALSPSCGTRAPGHDGSTLSTVSRATCPACLRVSLLILKEMGHGDCKPQTRPRIQCPRWIDPSMDRHLMILHANETRRAKA